MSFDRSKAVCDCGDWCEMPIGSNRIIIISHDLDPAQASAIDARAMLGVPMEKRRGTNHDRRLFLA
jgi:hypothetical protein